MSNTTKRQLALRKSIVAVLAASAAAASTAQGMLEEIVVTAQKRAQSVNDVGITVNAFTGGAIKDMGVTTATDLANFTPGLSVNSAGATGVPVYTIRGVGFQDLTTSSSSTVGLYFDEVAIPYTVMSRGVLFDVERVEVLKGPQGDLYGRNTTAGQINFISNKPTEEFEGGLTLSLGRFENVELEGYVSGSLADTVQGRLSFKTNQSGKGWQESLTRPGDTLGEKDVMAVRTLVNVDLSDKASLLLNFHYVDDQSDNQAPTAYDGREAGFDEFGAPYFPLNEYRLPTGANFGETPPWYSTGDNQDADWNNSWTNPVTGETDNLRPARDNQLQGLAAKLEWDLGGMLLTSVTGYDEFERREANDVDGTSFSVQENINATDLKVFSQELRLSGEGPELTWVAGLYYSHDEIDELYNFFMGDSIFGDGSAAWGLPTPFATTPIRRLHTRYEQETDSRAIFGHVEYNLTDKARLTVGLRYTEEERDWTGCTYDAGDGTLATFMNANFGTTLQAGDCGTIDDDPNSPAYIFAVIGSPNANNAFHPYSTDISTKKWMGKLGLDYAITDDILAYATLSNAFKSGGFNGNNSQTTSQLTPYKPEELTSLEIGLKTTLLNGSMQLNTSAFHYDYKDKQEGEFVYTFVGAIAGLGNVPESKVEGVEVDLQWVPLSGLSLNAGVAYLNTGIEEWVTPLPTGSLDPATGDVIGGEMKDASGEALPQSPEWSYNLTARYEWSIGNDLMMEIGGDLNYTGDMPDPVRPQGSVDSRTLVNARVGLSDVEATWRLLLWSRNLTNEYYYNAAFGGINGGYARMVGMPRTYGISLEYNF